MKVWKTITLSHKTSNKNDANSDSKFAMVIYTNTNNSSPIELKHPSFDTPAPHNDREKGAEESYCVDISKYNILVGSIKMIKFGLQDNDNDGWLPEWIRLELSTDNYTRVFCDKRKWPQNVWFDDSQKRMRELYPKLDLTKN